MPQPKKGYRLGAGPDHQRLMLRNLALSLFEHERVQTTEAKAKALRPFAEKLITKAKKGSVHHRRLVLAELHDREVTHKLFDDIGPRFSERPGGYTRILKVGPRNGDGAPMALIELVEEGIITPADTSERAGGRRTRRAGRRAGATRQDPAQADAASGTVEMESGQTEDDHQADAEEAGERGAEAGDARSETSLAEPGDEEVGEQGPGEDEDRGGGGSARSDT